MVRVGGRGDRQSPSRSSRRRIEALSSRVAVSRGGRLQTGPVRTVRAGREAGGWRGAEARWGGSAELVLLARAVRLVDDLARHPVARHDERRGTPPSVFPGAVSRGKGGNARRREGIALVATHGAWLASRSRCSRPHARGASSVRSHLSGEPRRAGGSEGVARDILVNVHSLCVLAQIVESRESA